MWSSDPAARAAHRIALEREMALGGAILLSLALTLVAGAVAFAVFMA